MGRLIIIKKIKEADGIHYYSVFKTESLDEISYYMGLNPINKQLLFFRDEKLTNPSGIYDIISGKFEYKESGIKSLINNYAVIKGIKAIKENYFPDIISFQS